MSLIAMQRFAFLIVMFIGLCTPLIAQEAVSRVSVTARFVPNGGSSATATIPEALFGAVTVPLQITPAAVWLLTATPTNDGQLTVSVSDTSLMRPPSGTAASAPVVIVQGTFPFTFGRPVTVMQTSTYRIEVLLTPL